MNAWWNELLLALQNPWLILGLLGQSLFFSRWIIQLYVTEKRKQSVVPPGFWYASFAGGLLTFIYALQRADPVFIIAQFVGLVNYTRNIQLIHRDRSSRRS